jgi:hypothetical protein
VTCKDITTQLELDGALADDDVTCLHIKSSAGVWITVTDNHNRTVRAYDSATVEAYDSATVEAYDSATVRASGSATVEAYDSATVRASGSATVEAYDSATVRAYDSATVRASGSATVEAYDSATVRASGSATVRASGSATVEAYDSATVRASGSATVRASGSATAHLYHATSIKAAPHVAVHLHSEQATIQGGVLIDLTQLDLTDARSWADHHDVDITDSRVSVYKALGDDLTTGQSYGHPYTYTVGAELVCADWRDDNDCGGGLHLSPTPHQAAAYRSTATRFVRCTAALEDVRPITDGGTAKCKVRVLRVEEEVDGFARPIQVGAAQ